MNFDVNYETRTDTVPLTPNEAKTKFQFQPLIGSCRIVEKYLPT